MSKKINFFETFNVSPKSYPKFEFGGSIPTYQDGGVLTDDIMNAIDQVRQSQDPEMALQVINAIADQLGMPDPSQQQADPNAQMQAQGQPQMQAQEQPMYAKGGKMSGHVHTKDCKCGGKVSMAKGGSMSKAMYEKSDKDKSMDKKEMSKKPMTAMEKMKMAKNAKKHQAGGGIMTPKQPLMPKGMTVAGKTKVVDDQGNIRDQPVFGRDSASYNDNIAKVQRSNAMDVTSQYGRASSERNGMDNPNLLRASKRQEMLLKANPNYKSMMK